MNTALLTGIPQSVPVRLVVVETGGAVSEVTQQMGCESSNKQVLQVRNKYRHKSFWIKISNIFFKTAVVFSHCQIISQMRVRCRVTKHA